MIPEPIATADRLGGPVGSHGRPTGRWFDPGSWAFASATLIWVLAMARQSACSPHPDGTSVNAVKRMCYSDIPVTYLNSGLALGRVPFLDIALPLPVVNAALAGFTADLTRLFIPGTSRAQIGAASNLFFVLTSIGLFVMFALVVGSHLLMGRTSARSVFINQHGQQVGRRQRSWDALFVAISIPVFTAGMINWDLVPAGLTAVAMLAWARARLVTAGVVLGLAISAGGYPILVLVALGVLCWRADEMAAWARTGTVAMATWILVNVPLAVLQFDTWSAWSSQRLGRQADLGSLWYLLQRAGVSVPFGRQLSLVLFAAIAVAVAVICQRTPTRPRVPQVAFVLVMGWLVVGQAYSPQYVLWTFPLLMLARPVFFDWLVFSLAEGLYWWVVWLYLNGDLGPGADTFYGVILAVRVVVEVWMMMRVFSDMFRPWQDPVRIPHVDDPCGGVLDHAPDVSSGHIFAEFPDEDLDDDLDDDRDDGTDDGTDDGDDGSFDDEDDPDALESGDDQYASAR